MKIPKKNSKLGIYLYESGAIETGDESIIKAKIKEYYRTYDKEIKQKKRKTEKRNFTISFPMSDIQHIRRRAKQYSYEITEYIKLLVKADITNTSVTENTVTYKEILQLLQYYKNAVKDIEEKEVKSWLGVNKNYEALANIINTLETDIRTLVKKHI